MIANSWTSERIGKNRKSMFFDSLALSFSIQARFIKQRYLEMNLNVASNGNSKCNVVFVAILN